MSFRNYLNHEQPLADQLRADLEMELKVRDQIENPFPLHVFHPAIKPFLKILYTDFDVPISYIGLSMLTCYSTAIGNAYHFNNAIGSMPLNIWAALFGISSAGKSIVMKYIFRPINEKQKVFSKEFQQKTEGLSMEQIKYVPLKKLVFKDIQIPTLIRSVVPDNPKGMIKLSDEILEWILGMNPNSRSEGNEEQFWLKCWDGDGHQITRSGKQETYVEKMFINTLGSIQPELAWKLFKNDRKYSGFIPRLLFAVPDNNKIALPNASAIIPVELESLHRKIIWRLYDGLPVDDLETGIRRIIFDPLANRTWEEWRNMKGHQINKIAQEDSREFTEQSIIYGKIIAYSIRMACILHLSDKAYEGAFFQQEEIVKEPEVNRAIELAEYFFKSAQKVYKMAGDDEVMDAQTGAIANMFRNGKSYAYIGREMFPELTAEYARKKAKRIVAQKSKLFPRSFGLKEK